MAPPGAGALDLQIIVDNDFALFSGTSTSINTLLFQNERQWSTQLNGQTAPVANPPSSDSYFYLLAMDGGAPAEVFGTIDGQSFVNLQGMLMSDDLSSKLSNYDFNAVTDGTYTPVLADVQAALNGLSFQAPVLGCSVVRNQLGAYVSNKSYIFPTSARLFSFPVSSVPGPLPILGALTGLHASRKIRRRIQSVKS